MVRVEIDGQYGSAFQYSVRQYWCATPERIIQETMPAELEGHIPSFQWKEFVSQANQCFAGTDQKIKLLTRVRLSLFCFYALFPFVAAGSLIFTITSVGWYPSSAQAGLVFLAIGVMLFVVSTAMACCQSRIASLANQGLESLKQVCETASSANGNVSFIVKDDSQGYGRNLVHKNYIEVGVAQIGAAAIVGAITPQVISMMPDLEQQQVVSGSAVGQAVCPKCGNACAGMAFCSNCGNKLT